MEHKFANASVEASVYEGKISSNEDSKGNQDEQKTAHSIFSILWSFCKQKSKH
jgi:hypothetical protein